MKERNDLHDYEEPFNSKLPARCPDRDKESFREFWERLERDAKLHATLLEAATPEQLRGKV